MVHRYVHTEVLSQRHVLRRQFAHTHAFTQGWFYTQIPACTGVFTQGCFHAKKLLHTVAWVPGCFYAAVPLQRSPFTSTQFYTGLLWTQQAQLPDMRARTGATDSEGLQLLTRTPSTLQLKHAECNVCNMAGAIGHEPPHQLLGASPNSMPNSLPMNCTAPLLSETTLYPAF